MRVGEGSMNIYISVRSLREAVKLHCFSMEIHGLPSKETFLFSQGMNICPPLKREGTPLRRKTVKMDCS
jgi:hypothetical protein